MHPKLYLWLTVIHIVSVMAYVVSLFYLPRILVHISEGTAAGQSVKRLFIMARKLFRFGNYLFALAFVTGLWVALEMGYFTGQGWMHAKLTLVFLFFGYNHMTYSLVKKAERGNLTWSTKSSALV